MTGRQWRLVVRPPAESISMLPHQRVDDLSPRGRPHPFRFSASLMAAVSIARSAYIRFNLAFSGPSLAEALHVR